MQVEVQVFPDVGGGGGGGVFFFRETEISLMQMLGGNRKHVFELPNL